MTEEILNDETIVDDEETLVSEGDLLDFQQAILELASEFDHLPVIGIVGALHTAAHVLTTAAFDPSDDELGEDDEEGEDDGPLAVSYAVDED